MNFDFLKDLCGLGRVYENCNNAEKLAVAMPAQSMLAARKSAELIAKFIYMAAHNVETEDMTFADILSDTSVTDFVNNGEFMDALHFIEESGDAEETAETAVTVLRDLQYVAGETACMLRLIDDYPVFEDEIVASSDDAFIDEEDIDKKAREMFLEYAKDFDVREERDRYMKEKDFHDYINYHFNADAEMHERLEFYYKPKQTALIESLGMYLLHLLCLSIKCSQRKEAQNDFYDTLDARLVIDGLTYSFNDKDAFIEAVVEKLPKANGFIIDVSYPGISIKYLDGKLNECGDSKLDMLIKDTDWTGLGMLELLQQYKRRNPFEYKLSAFLPGCGEFEHVKISKGRDIDVMSACTYSEDLLDKDIDGVWWSYSLDLGVEFDFEKHRDVLLKLQDIVRGSIPEDEIKYCEEVWEDGEVNLLCAGNQWCCSRMREVQDFLDKVNEVLLPIKDEVSASTNGSWEARNDFAVATWVWTDEGFKVIGTYF